MNLLVTGGCGFIGSNFIEQIINKKQVSKLVNLDSLSYAANPDVATKWENHRAYHFNKADISDYAKVHEIFYKHDIRHVVHFAAETHVDNSILSPDAFIDTNILGTHNLLKAALHFNVRRFHHVSTDEVYGHLKKGEMKFHEGTPYNPRNPYSASKAAADFLVRSYFHTYDLPITISNCSNNYGPGQNAEKFIPTVINSLLDESKIPIYGDGENIRDWIHVKDHCSALWKILTKGELGETYLVGADCEKTNLEIVTEICNILDKNSKEYISFVEDRKAHDFRYAICNHKIMTKLKWKPSIPLKKGLKKTVDHYKLKL